MFGTLTGDGWQRSGYFAESPNIRRFVFQTDIGEIIKIGPFRRMVDHGQGKGFTLWLIDGKRFDLT